MNGFQIAEWNQRYEVSKKGAPATDGDELRAGPLAYIRSAVHGRQMSLGFRKLQKFSGKSNLYRNFGIFQKFLEIAGDIKIPLRNGTLYNEQDKPATIEDLCFILDLPKSTLIPAIQALIKAGWMIDSGNSQILPKIPGNSGQPDHHRNDEHQSNSGPKNKKTSPNTHGLGETVKVRCFSNTVQSKNQSNSNGLLEKENKTALALSKSGLKSGGSDTFPKIPGNSGTLQELNSTQLNSIQDKDRENLSKKQYLDHVLLSDEEHTKLIERFGSKETTVWIEKLDSYIGSKGRKYKSHYKTIISWSLKDGTTGNDQNKRSPENNEPFIR